MSQHMNYHERNALRKAREKRIQDAGPEMLALLEESVNWITHPPMLAEIHALRAKIDGENHNKEEAS